jgi:hypothetical protein
MAQLTEIISNFGAGIHQGAPILDLPEGTSIQLKNVAIKNKQYISNRKGYVKFSRDVIKSGGIAQPITGLYEYNYGNTKRLLVTVGNTLYLYNPTTHVYTSSGRTITTGYKQHFIKHYNNIIMYNGVDTPIYFDGSAFGLVNNAPIGNFMESYTGHLFSSNNDNKWQVRFSEPYESYQSWPATYQLLISESKFDPMTAFKKINDFIGGLCFSEQNIFTITGTNYKDFAPFPKTSERGCINQEVLQISDGRPIWLDRSGFYTIGESGMPQRFYQLDNIFADVVFNRLSHAWGLKYWGGLNSFEQYLCALTIGTGNTANNYLFVYDYISGGWRFDTKLPCEILANGKDANGNGIVYAVNNNDGWIYQLYNGNSDNGRPIDSSYISYPITMMQMLGPASVNKDKIFEEVEIWYWSEFAGSFDIMAITDFEENEYPGSGLMENFEITGDGEPPPQYYFDASESDSHFLRNKRLRKFSVPMGPLDGRSLMLRIDCNEPIQNWEIQKIIVRASEK